MDGDGQGSDPRVNEQKFEVETPFGPVWLWGRDTGKALVVVATGAFAQFWVYDRLQLAMPDVDVVRFHLPSNHSPALSPPHLGVIARGLRIALETLYPGRPTAVFGLSTGALVALALDAPQVRRLVLVEPFLRTDAAWPLRQLPGKTTNDDQRELLWSVLGVAPDRCEPRDYRHLLERLTIPTIALVGSTPLGEPRPLPDGMPSLVDDEDRALLAAHPYVTLVEAAGGHNVAATSLEVVYQALRRAATIVVSEQASPQSPSR